MHRRVTCHNCKIIINGICQCTFVTSILDAFSSAPTGSNSILTSISASINDTAFFMLIPFLKRLKSSFFHSRFELLSLYLLIYLIQLRLIIFQFFVAIIAQFNILSKNPCFVWFSCTLRVHQPQIKSFSPQLVSVTAKRTVKIIVVILTFFFFILHCSILHS